MQKCTLICCIILTPFDLFSSKEQVKISELHSFNVDETVHFIHFCRMERFRTGKLPPLFILMLKNKVVLVTALTLNDLLFK